MRSLRSKIKKGKKLKPLSIVSQNDLINMLVQKKIDNVDMYQEVDESKLKISNIKEIKESTK